MHMLTQGSDKTIFTSKKYFSKNDVTKGQSIITNESQMHVKYGSTSWCKRIVTL